MMNTTEYIMEEMEPIRILGIAPYNSMKVMLEQQAQERSNLVFDVFVGDMQEGLDIVKNYNDGYDVILSRGGTADLIRKNISTPVVDIPLSIYDVLCSMKLAENYEKQYAFVGFPGISETARTLCDLLQYDIDIFTVNDIGEVNATLLDLKNRGYHMILCDMVTHTTAKELGMNALLITSGTKSISDALNQAIRLGKGIQQKRLEKAFLEDIIRKCPCRVVVMEESGKITLNSEAGSEPNISNSGDKSDINLICEYLKKQLSQVLAGQLEKFSRTFDGKLYQFTCHVQSLGRKRYGIFYYDITYSPYTMSQSGIQFLNLSDVQDRFFNSFFSITSSSDYVQASIENMSRNLIPVLFTGETGTGKEQAARNLYAMSSLNKNELVTIHCGILTDKSWEFLINHHNSPLYDQDKTIFFKELSDLSKDKRKHLLSILCDTNICNMNRILFSCTCSDIEELPEDIREYVNLLSCITLRLPTLKEHKQELASLAILYLNSLNTDTSSMIEYQIVGFEPEAMELLKEYDWPYNYAQFKRILNELAMITKTPYIQTSNVSFILEREKAQRSEAEGEVSTKEPKGTVAPGQFHGNSTLNLDQPLNDIIHDIAYLALMENGGNQTATARKLGISRTTLWRYLNK